MHSIVSWLSRHGWLQGVDLYCMLQGSKFKLLHFPDRLVLTKIICAETTFNYIHKSIALNMKELFDWITVKIYISQISSSSRWLTLPWPCCLRLIDTVWQSRQVDQWLMAQWWAFKGKINFDYTEYFFLENLQEYIV